MKRNVWPLESVVLPSLFFTGTRIHTIRSKSHCIWIHCVRHCDAFEFIFEFVIFCAENHHWDNIFREHIYFIPQRDCHDAWIELVFSFNLDLLPRLEPSTTMKLNSFFRISSKDVHSPIEWTASVTFSGFIHIRELSPFAGLWVVFLSSFHYFFWFSSSCSY